MNPLRPTASRCLVTRDPAPGAGAAQAVRAALAARFEVHLGTPRSVRTLWLDTPDSRVARAGATLRDVRVGRDRSLVLSGGDGAQIAQAISQTAALRWPARADALPEGPVRDALGALAGIRALAPIVDARATRTPARLLDDAQKTVVDAVIEAPEDGGTAMADGAAADSAAMPLRVELTAVRGYEAQLRRAERALRPLCGQPIDPIAHSMPPSAPADWQVPRRPAPRVEPDERAARALAIVLLDDLDAVQANIPGALRDIDTEYLHDIRVAARATRSLIKLAGDALPGEVAAAFRERWRWLAHLTAATRDLDVLLLAVDGLDGSVDIEGIDGLAPYRSWLAARRRTEFARMRQGLGSAQVASLADDWRSALQHILDAPVAGPAAAHLGAAGPAISELAIADLAAARIARARKRALAQARRVDADSTPDDLHELRKRIKEMRYLQEAFGATAPNPSHKSEVRALKALQDCLGRIQDTAVLLESFDQFAASHPQARARTTMALGALGDRQRRRRSQARAALPELLAPIA